MSTSKPKHIFIVDDNEIYSMMLDYVLSRDSIYEFVSFKSGEECIENLYLDPDVIILDYVLPGKNGLETLQEIKKIKPGIHVVILTSNKDSNVAVSLLKAGADYIVLKEEHGEEQIIKKIEAVLSEDETESNTVFGIRNNILLERLIEVSLIFILLTLGFFITKEYQLF